MELSTILTVVSVVLGLIATLAGGLWAKSKGKLNAAKELAREAFELVDVAVSSIEDDKITVEEVEKIKEEAQQVKIAWRVLIGKTE